MPFGNSAPAISAKIPMIIGSTKDEWGMPYARDQADMTEAQLTSTLNSIFGARADAILRAFKTEYPGLKPAQMIGTILSAPMRNDVLKQVSAKHAQGAAPVFTYWFRWETPVLGGMPRAFHCSDLPHCFANAERCESTTGNTPEARQLSDRMSQAWINFARTGNPSQAGLTWPAFDPKTIPTMVFDTRSRVENDPAGAARRSLI
jgi:para-nitrobenzyl esterase